MSFYTGVDFFNLHAKHFSPSELAGSSLWLVGGVISWDFTTNFFEGTVLSFLIVRIKHSDFARVGRVLNSSMEIAPD
jgi:hypothetical protein